MSCVVCSMIERKGILIKNIFYMLSYADQVLWQSHYEDIAAEEFQNIHDLFAGILAAGLTQQLKQGLYREYIPQIDDLPVLRGKLDMQRTIRHKLQQKTLLACEYDQLTENNAFNQILKATAEILLHAGNVKEERRQALKRVLLFFHDIDPIEPFSINWSTLTFHRHNRSYEMLLNICYFVISGLLLTTEKGRYKMAAFLKDINMARLFEKFVLEYYRCHHPQLHPAPRQVQWDTDEESVRFLPSMNTDIMLKHGNQTLIIDTKYYSRTMQTTPFGSHTLHSGNLYQIFAYVKNEDKKRTGNVSGLLLYAKTGESIAPDCDVKLGGNRIVVKTLDLNVPFSEIAGQLDGVVEMFFESYPSEVRTE
jgi:5-methylcytosine-specific restriction enzyme subunit McrC